MPRTITINFARYTTDVFVASFDPATMTGVLSVGYQVGQQTDGPDGPIMVLQPAAANNTTASVPFSNDAVVSVLLEQLLAAIAEQEGLAVPPHGTDHIYDQALRQLV